MKVQSLSVCVPTTGCPNRCPFCVSQMHDEEYPVQEDLIELKKRLQFARDNSCNTMIITGRGEALSNKSFLKQLKTANRELISPFVWIEIQTSGNFLNSHNYDFLKEIGVTTLSLSIANIFDSDDNVENYGIREKNYNLPRICKEIKDQGFNLRLSINMVDIYNNKNSKEIFDQIQKLGADQVTFRKLFASPDKTLPQSRFVLEHSASSRKLKDIEHFIQANGRKLETLPFGATKYSVEGVGAVVDDDCMDVEAKDTMKFLVLRENLKLYSKWDDQGSLIF